MERHQINYWLKPIGTAVDNKKHCKDKKFATYVKLCFENKECQFKRNTEQINKDDILICYLSGLQQIIYISEVTEDGSADKYPIEERQNDPTKERWPYHVNVKTLRNTGLLLNKNLYLQALKSMYLTEINQERVLTIQGDKDFKRIRQKDRLELDLNFAEFILNEIKK